MAIEESGSDDATAISAWDPRRGDDIVGPERVGTLSDQAVQYDRAVERGAFTWPYDAGSVASPAPRRRWGSLRYCLDAALLAAGTVLTSVFTGTRSDLWNATMLVSTLAAYWLAGLYRPRLRLDLASELRGVASATGFVVLALSAVAMVVFGRDGIGDAAIVHWLLGTTLVAGGRVAMFGLERVALRNPDSGRRTLIVGAGRVGHLVAKRLLDEPGLGLTPIGFLDKDPLTAVNVRAAGRHSELRVLGASWDLEQVIAEHGVEQVVVAFSTAPHHVMLELVRRCWSMDVAVMVVPRLYEVDGRRTQVEHLGALPLVSVQAANPRGWQFACKYAVDRLVAGVVLVTLLPILAVIAGAILVSMGRPVLFRQRRVGRDGHVFEMLKFRTMRGAPDVAGEADSAWAALILAGTSVDPGDVKDRSAIEDRRTAVGSVLRKLSLDELPQLWNVLRGDMSLVGPRPERLHYVQQFERAVYRYPDRHRVKSGLTGWAQVHGLRGQTSLDDRIEWDNFYIENWSPALDLKILFRTLPALLGRRGGA
jgi:exopolysaccharide biosynthesis polyprenyl glycosylphosphotransferase